MVTAAAPEADSPGGGASLIGTFSVVAKCGQSVTESPSPAYTEIYRSIRHRAEGSALVFLVCGKGSALKPWPSPRPLFGLRL